ncbi:unnamed protein product [Adineta steineri]|uniref:Uncharacterized protein n=1 Tax=Adineta steineri TaxID=433720 RepID=A0A819U835_9BILA|nr:unnamed protein product [Adineta steineri]
MIGNIPKSLWNVTQNQCICEMINSNGTISTLNYFSINQTYRITSTILSSSSTTSLLSSSSTTSSSTALSSTSSSSSSSTTTTSTSSSTTTTNPYSSDMRY